MLTIVGDQVRTAELVIRSEPERYECPLLQPATVELTQRTVLFCHVVGSDVYLAVCDEEGVVRPVLVA